MYFSCLLHVTCINILIFVKQHIEGWTGRLMAWRRRNLQSDPTLNLRWTILPPQFSDTLLQSVPKSVVGYGNGKENPFPSFFDVDFVFFPLPIDNNEWMLVRLELASQELVLYPFENFYGRGDKFRAVVIPR